VLFKLKVGKVKLANSFDADAEFSHLKMLELRPGEGDVGKESEASIPDQVNHFKKLYSLQQVDLFADLQFEWSSFQAKEENLIDFGADSSRKLNEMIACCVGSPAMNFVSCPILVRVRNQREIEQVRIHQPFTVEYEVTN